MPTTKTKAQINPGLSLSLDEKWGSRHPDKTEEREAAEKLYGTAMGILIRQALDVDAGMALADAAEAMGTGEIISGPATVVLEREDWDLGTEGAYTTHLTITHHNHPKLF